MLNSAWVDEPIFVGWATPTDASSLCRLKRRWAYPPGDRLTPRAPGYRGRPGKKGLPKDATFYHFSGIFLKCTYSFFEMP